MYGSNQLGLSQRKNVIIPLEVTGVIHEPRPPEVLFGERMSLNHGAHGSVEHKDSLIQQSSQHYFFFVHGQLSKKLLLSQQALEDVSGERKSFGRGILPFGAIQCEPGRAGSA